MNINQSINFNGTITLKDVNGVDVSVAYLTASLDNTNQNLSINVNVQNKELLDTENATNIAGETAETQYTEFETTLKNSAKALGFVIFE